jgi:hypothetical protein
MQQSLTFIFNQAISAIITLAVLIPILLFIMKKWISARIEQSIRNSYEVKNRAALVADLLSEWISHPQDRTRLNRLTFEAFLWLPQGIAEELSKRLANEIDAPDVRAIIIQVRRHLLGANDDLDPQKVNIFPTLQKNTDL